MQKVILLLSFSIAIALFNPKLSAQSALDREIEGIVNQLVAKMNGNVAIKSVAVADFTNLDNMPTALGKFLADEFIFALSNISTSFAVVDRSRVNALLKEAGLNAQGLLDPAAATKLGKLKAIDVIIVGTLTATGNYIRVNVRAIKLESAAVLAAARGDISKTPTIDDLEKKELANPEGNSPDVPKTPRDEKKQPPLTTYKKDNVLYEILECRQSGQNIICSLQVTAEEQDVNLTFFGGTTGTRLLDADSGNEYLISNLNIADKHDNRRIDKTIIAGYPVKASLTFTGVSKKVNLISMLEMSTGINSRWFKAEVRNIPVKQQ